jgi:hypothetical protein
MAGEQVFDEYKTARLSANKAGANAGASESAVLPMRAKTGKSTVATPGLLIGASD